MPLLSAAVLVVFLLRNRPTDGDWHLLTGRRSRSIAIFGVRRQSADWLADCPRAVYVVSALLRVRLSFVDPVSVARGRCYFVSCDVPCVLYVITFAGNSSLRL